MPFLFLLIANDHVNYIKLARPLNGIYHMYSLPMTMSTTISWHGHCMKFIYLYFNRRDATLLTAERILKTLFKTLDNWNLGPFAESLLIQVKGRIGERRPDTLIHLMEYLYNPNYFKENSKDQFAVSTKKQKAIDLASEQLERLFKIEYEDEATPDDTPTPAEDKTLSFKEEMEVEIQTIGSVDLGDPTKLAPKITKKSLKKELALYEESGVRTANLTVLLKALNSIQPTSCESEAQFNTVSKFMN